MAAFREHIADEIHRKFIGYREALNESPDFA
jgi:hypothetical protein